MLDPFWIFNYKGPEEGALASARIVKKVQLLFVGELQ
jgi:hypothetical protein